MLLYRLTWGRSSFMKLFLAEMWKSTLEKASFKEKWISKRIQRHLLSPRVTRSSSKFFWNKNGEPLKSWHRVYHIFEKWYWKWPLISKVLFFSLSPFRNRAKHPRKLFLKRKEKQFFIKLIYGFLVCWCVCVS